MGAQLPYHVRHDEARVAVEMMAGLAQVGRFRAQVEAAQNVVGEGLRERALAGDAPCPIAFPASARPSAKAPVRRRSVEAARRAPV
jgi:hypothetical protein